MTTSIETLIVDGFVVFCRVAGCVMTAPAIGSERIPVRVRLYISIGVSIALAAPLLDTVEKALHGASLATVIVVSISETVIGVLIGLTCRLFLLAMETMAAAVTMSIGLGNALGAPINEAEPLPALASLIVLGTTVLIFVLDQHLELIRGLRQSYEVVSISTLLSPDKMLREFAKTLGEAHLILLRISSPFLLFGLLTNVGLGFLNRMVPQVPVYFVSTPLLIILGVYWLYFLSPDMLASFSSDYGSWLTKG
jgi:flagellar biosynthetic protein FliR